MTVSAYEKGDERVTCRLPPSKDERGFKVFLWNPKTKTVLGRTGTSWAKIGLFYVVFYLLLALYFTLLMFIFFRTLEPHTPKYTGSESLLVNPGLSFYPRTYHDDLRPTIKYNPKEYHNSRYVAFLNNVYEHYRYQPHNAIYCSPGDDYMKTDDPPCYFDLAAFNNTCGPNDHWGYSTHSPCILLKLNKIFHWKPQPPEGFEGLPEGLQRHINTSQDPLTLLKQNAWVWCESEDVAIDQPSPGLPLSFFPYHKQKGYLAPLAPVRILDLPVGKAVMVRCRVWASNVPPKVGTRLTGEAKILFELTA